MRLEREIKYFESNDDKGKIENEPDNSPALDKPNLDENTTETLQTTTAVIEETKDLMQEIMTLDEEDLKVIIGDKVTQKKIEIYKEYIQDKIQKHLQDLEVDFEEFKNE